MTKAYRLRPRPRVPTALQPPPETRLPTYPKRPLAFRWYPAGWWVWHQHLDFCGRVEWSEWDKTKILGGALYSTGDLLSCTAKQATRLDYTRGVSPVCASVAP